MRPDHFDWHADAVQTLLTLVREGKSYGQIGRIMGLKKNQVIGKAHRLAVEARPSPIRAAPRADLPPPGTKSQARARRYAADRRARVAALAAAPSPPRSEESRIIQRVQARALNVARRIEGRLDPVAPPTPLARLAPGFTHRRCQWPQEDAEGRIGFACAEAILPGNPYCAAHCARGYVPWRAAS